MQVVSRGGEEKGLGWFWIVYMCFGFNSFEVVVPYLWFQNDFGLVGVQNGSVKAPN